MWISLKPIHYHLSLLSYQNMGISEIRSKPSAKSTAKFLMEVVEKSGAGYSCTSASYQKIGGMNQALPAWIPRENTWNEKST